MSCKEHIAEKCCRQNREKADCSALTDVIRLYRKECCSVLEEELGKALASIGLANTPSQKAYVTEVVEPDAFCLLESKVLDLDEVNYLAKLMDSEDAAERKTLFVVAAYEGYGSPKELINLHFNLDCYTLIQSTDDMAAVGRRYMYSVKKGMSLDEVENTDFEKIGRYHLS